MEDNVCRIIKINKELTFDELRSLSKEMTKN